MNAQLPTTFSLLLLSALLLLWIPARRMIQPPRRSGGDARAKTTAVKSRKAADSPADTPKSIDGSQMQRPLDPANAARTVHYGERDVCRVRARLRFTTLIVLPKAEQILDFVCGDKEFWVVNGAQNFAYVKPAKAGGRTNLNLVTASGNVYSFVLTEGEAEPDLKIFVEPRDESMISAVNGAPGSFRLSRSKTIGSRWRSPRPRRGKLGRRPARAIETEVSSFRSQYPTQMRFDYRFQAEPAAFHGHGHVSRWQVHVHPGEAAGSSGPLRSEGRQAQSRSVSVQGRHVRRGQDHGRRLSRNRETAAAVLSRSELRIHG